jgi:hypothetical protein
MLPPLTGLAQSHRQTANNVITETQRMEQNGAG